MKKILYSICFLPVIIGIYGMYINISMNQEFVNGQTVVAKVIEEPQDCEGLGERYTFIKLQYENQLFLKRVNKSFCPFLGKGELTVVISRKRDKVFFVAGENFGRQIFFSFLISLFGAFCSFKIIKAWKAT